MTATIPETGVRSARVVVAEDDEEMRWLVSDTLRKAGHQVFEARDGSELLACFAVVFLAGRHPQDLIDLVIADNRMPSCDGMDIVHALREANWKTPVIIMTGFGDNQTRVRAESLGAVLLVKPFRLADLKKAADELLCAST